MSSLWAEVKAPEGGDFEDPVAGGEWSEKGGGNRM